MKNKYCKEDLEKLISEEKLSYEAIGKMYGVSGNAIRKAAKRLGIELPKRRAINESETFNKGISKRKDKVFCKNCGKDITHKYGNIYCDVHCQTEFQRREKYEYFLTEPEEFQRADYNPSKWIRSIILEEQNGKCNICGIPNEWNGKELTFILDYIDGRASHNVRSNLRLICPNCDSQLDTYKSKNKNSDRTYRYNKQE